MGFFSKLFSKSSTEQQKEHHTYDSVLNLIIIYKGFKDTDEQAEKYSDLEDELWGYDCIGASGAMSAETARQNGIPLPVYPDYPVIGIFDLTMSKGHVEGYEKPLILSSNKEEVKQFLKGFERER